jgi:hypothetical protein
MVKVKETVLVSDILDNPPLLNIKFRAGAGSRCGFGSTKIMRLLAAPAPAQ